MTNRSKRVVDKIILALWKEQQEAFQTNPLFNLRKEIRRQETNDRICDILRLLLNHRK